MAAGPTQNYDDASLVGWRPRPVLAFLLRTAVSVVPVLLALGLGWAAVQWAPAHRLGIPVWLWLVAQITLSTLLLLGVGHALRRLLPLSTMLRLSLVFPDSAPSRFEIARRTYSPDALRRRIEQAAPGEVSETDHHALRLLELVDALNAHDRTTFRHSERVQAYAALIGDEMGLGREDASKLSWAALLHDVGKLHIPTDILNKTGRPTAEEWHVLTCHPEEGARIVEPLLAWLGPWAEAVHQHHERWDGGGYPAGLAGTQISPAARIVAVADAFDVITSARSYKKPLSPDAARAELARCAGSQFDPEAVRAFLSVGLGSLRRVAGPASLLSGVPALRSIVLPDAATAVSGLAATVPAVGATATATVVTAALAVGGATGVLPAAAVGHTAVAVGTVMTDTGEVGTTGPTADPADPTNLGRVDVEDGPSADGSGEESSDRPDPADRAPDHAGTTGRPDHAGTTGRPDHAGTPGRPDHAGTTGRPDHAGPPAHAGNPGRPEGSGPPLGAGTPGRPENAGRPDQAGPPENAGPPQQSGAPEKAGPPAHAGTPGPAPQVGGTTAPGAPAPAPAPAAPAPAAPAPAAPAPASPAADRGPGAATPQDAPGRGAANGKGRPADG